MELVCMDHLSLEKSECCHENNLVIAIQFTRCSVATPTRNQTAQTIRQEFCMTMVHYDFPSMLHSHKITGIKRSRTTSYQPMGIRMMEGFNQTLLRMLGTLTTVQKTEWKPYVPSLVHSYNSTKHKILVIHILYSAYPRLPIDVNVDNNNKIYLIKHPYSMSDSKALYK